MKHILLDFETFGQEVFDCAIIDCSVITVDTEVMISDNPYGLHSIENVERFKLNVKEQVDKYGWVIYKDSLDFWSQQSVEAKRRISPSKEDISIKEFVLQFTEHLIKIGKVDYWWSRSNTFDPLLLWRLYNSQQQYHTLNSHLPFWRIRDTRTFIDAKFDFPKKNGFIPIKDVSGWEKNFIEHDSSWDVLADALRMQAIIRAEKDLEQV